MGGMICLCGNSISNDNKEDFICLFSRRLVAEMQENGKDYMDVNHDFEIWFCRKCNRVYIYQSENGEYAENSMPHIYVKDIYGVYDPEFEGSKEVFYKEALDRARKNQNRNKNQNENGNE